MLRTDGDALSAPLCRNVTSSLALRHSVGSSNTEAAGLIRAAVLEDEAGALKAYTASMFGRGGGAPSRVGSTVASAGAQKTDPTMPVSLMMTDVQTAGRGRLGRRWVNYPRESLLASAVVTLPRDLATGPDAGWITITAGLAVLDALAATLQTCGARARRPSALALKWPNDVFCDGLKLAGILSELVRTHRDEAAVVIGIGMNLIVDPAHLPDVPATSLHLHYAPLPGYAELRDRLAAGVVVGISQRLGMLARDPEAQAALLRTETERVSWTLGRRVRAVLASGGEVVGTALSINRDASLSIRTDGGKVATVSTADVGVLPEPEDASGEGDDR